MFCFPCAGGGPSLFRNWAPHFPPSVEVLAVALPGREGRWREAPRRDLRILVTEVAEALLPLMDIPFIFFGHSMGALLAFELAKELRRRRCDLLKHLFVSGARAPQVEDSDPAIHRLPDDRFIKELDLQVAGIPRPVLENPALLKVLLPTLRADVELCEKYEYVADAPLSCPISAYGGVHDRKAGIENVGAWKVQTQCAFDSRFFSGGHFFITTAESELLTAILSEISRMLATPAVAPTDVGTRSLAKITT